MLSEQEKQDLKAMASSDELRRDCELLRRNSREDQRKLSLEQHISFLTAMSRLCPAASLRSIKPISGTKFKL